MIFGAWRLRWRRWGTKLVAGYASVLGLSGVLLAHAVMAVLSPAVYAHVYPMSGNSGAEQESGDAFGLPQSLADRFGWEEQVALIAQVYESLPSDEQRIACIFTANYGEASAYSVILLIIVLVLLFR